MSDLREAEYVALRGTIRERGTVRILAVLAGLASWAAAIITLSITELQGAVALVPLSLLAAVFEVNFFLHTGVERIGRYIQVFYEEATDSVGWETTAMRYGNKFPGGLDPLFVALFSIAGALNFVSSLPGARRPGWIAVSLSAHLVFAYRVQVARKAARLQRALDLDRFRSLLSK
jgi:hypothetical protein